MKKQLSFLIFSLAFIFVYPHFAFAQDIIFNKAQLPKGNLGFIGGVAQDKNGFLWIASGRGLLRYDGYEYKTYLNDPANPNSVGQDHLEKVYVDSKGIIWIATWTNGLDRFDPVSGKFTHFRHDPSDTSSLSHDLVRAIMQDHEGTLWIGTHGGLDRFDPATEKFTHYRYDPTDVQSLSCNRVRIIFEDRKGTLWIGTGSSWGETDELSKDEGGLNRFDRRTGKFTRFIYNPADPHSLINNKVQAIFEDSKGVFWVGTGGDGLHTLDRETGRFQRYPYDPMHPEKLSRPEFNTTNLYTDYITFINEDASGNIWIGTLGNGLNRYDRQTNKCFHYKLGNTNAVLNEPPVAMNFSRDGMVWISGFLGNLYIVDPFYKNISHVNVGSSVGSIAEEPSDILWIATGKGLIRKDKVSGISKVFVHDPHNYNSLSGDRIWSIHIDTDGLLWIGTNEGLDRLDPNSNTFIHYRNDPRNAHTLDTGGIFGLAKGGRDSLWMAGTNGLALLNTRTGSVTHYRYDPKDSNSLSSIDIRALQTDREGKVWVGTFLKGLNCLDPTIGKFKHFLKNIPDIFKIFEDSEGTVWVTTDAGIFIKKYNDADFVKFEDASGKIGTDIIAGILEDEKNNIYLRGNSRIYRNNLKNQETVSFDLSRVNSESSDIPFYVSYINDAYYGEDNNMYFSSSKGYFVFSPDNFKINPTPPEIIFTDLKINGKSVNQGGNGPLQTSIQETQEISLTYDQNNFSLDFAGIHYAKPESNQHLYTLQNYEDEWHNPVKEKTAIYSNLRPGEYMLRVKAANSDGVWAERDLKITITPPWWKRWWAYTLYISIFAVSIFLFDRLQRKRIIAKERERSRDRELAQAKEIEKAYSELKTTQTQLIHAEKMASLGELTAGIAHEIQNPLNFVNNFSEVNKELVDELQIELKAGKIDDAIAISNNIKDNEEKISHHGKRADAIVKGMLQHSQSSSGIKEPTGINALADEYLRLAYQGLRAKDKNFNATLKTDFDPAIGNISIIPQDIGRVLLNLINNAFYAVNERSKAAVKGYEPEVTISTRLLTASENSLIRQSANSIIISVADNGNGIPEKVLEKVFQPFFTTKPTGQGTGLGLSLSYDIIKAHQGKINIRNTPGAGAEFIITLPINA